VSTQRRPRTIGGVRTASSAGRSIAIPVRATDQRAQAPSELGLLGRNTTSVVGGLTCHTTRRPPTDSSLSTTLGSRLALSPSRTVSSRRPFPRRVSPDSPGIPVRRSSTPALARNRAEERRMQADRAAPPSRSPGFQWSVRACRASQGSSWKTPSRYAPATATGSRRCVTPLYRVGQRNVGAAMVADEIVEATTAALTQ